jgi:DNA repair exonuclease SbcCD ATPase subunit
MTTKPTHAQIELARVTREHEEAAKRYRTAFVEAQKLKSRINEAQQRQAEITRNRVAGNSNPDEAGEFVMLQRDIEAMEPLVKEAEARAAELQPTREEAALQAAQAAMGREHDQAIFDALSARLEALERAFCECLSATHAAGKRIGHVSLGKTWFPSKTLRSAVNDGFLRDWS